MKDTKQEALERFSKRIIKAQALSELERAKENEAVKNEVALLNIDPNQVSNYAMQNYEGLKKAVDDEAKKS